MGDSEFGKFLLANKNNLPILLNGSTVSAKLLGVDGDMVTLLASPSGGNSVRLTLHYTNIVVIS
ncbi:hypothetical protein [Shewanella sp.]|jgi:hypothetical protein|uniref:hypothetical protein n=1 Tax=Shewanella sp. TaxID=50422 RepID=UPI003D0C7A6A